MKKILFKVIPGTSTDTQIRVDAQTLGFSWASGNYSYSLMIDGKVVETKRMIISK